MTETESYHEFRSEIKFYFSTQQKKI